jgi:hypothetical protein
MHEFLPDFGDLILCIALLFGALIVIFETLERRRERRNEHLVLDEIAREYADCQRMGWF